MNQEDDWNEKRRKKSFNDEFEKILRMMEKMMGHSFLNFNFNEMEPVKPFVYRYRINDGSIRNPKVQEFRNHPRELSDENQSITDEPEPLTEIIECDNEVSITVEIPEVEKKDIDLRSTENNLDIRVDTPYKKYHQEIKLPCKVKPKTTKATYKNGVLDIIIKRKNNKHDEKDYRVDIE